MDLQQWATLFVTGGAVVYLVWRGATALRGKGQGCGHCSDCPSGGPDENDGDNRLPVKRPLVTLQSDLRDRP